MKGIACELAGFLFQGAQAAAHLARATHSTPGPILKNRNYLVLTNAVPVCRIVHEMGKLGPWPGLASFRPPLCADPEIRLPVFIDRARQCCR